MLKTPNFFIVGGRKCGTTAMHQYLKVHPDIFMPERKELNYFNTDMELSGHFVRDEALYHTYFSEATNENRIGEASFWYLYSCVAAKNISEFCPTAKIIIMLRNPIDVMYSAHGQQLFNGMETVADFESALKLEAARRKGLNIPRGSFSVHGYFYRNLVKYTEQITRYLQEFDENQIHIIIFDELKDNIGKTYRELLRFLQVNEEDFLPDFKVHNPGKRVRSVWLQSYIKHPPKTVSFFGDFLSEKLKHKIFMKFLNYNVEYSRRPPMNPELRRRLQKELKPEIDSLSKLIDRDLTHWYQ